ncbi:MAG: DNA polymerase III subunit gamma/tau [Oligoflexia bacterium]|nr:DNA polymerase III subunit gamma/tau [Oligoflexia bacterium]
MSYLVLARKYRPKHFSDLVGQDHVAKTFSNAFQLDKIGQAYLFTGTRGVGKTSAARIFAKALRCEDKDYQPGAKNYGLSCEKCPSCIEINQGSSIDVLEIDGASNNGVESVREIREQVKFLPSKGSKKVYIIDEVHMLSNAAFNALLKTLEEPPAHILFILATTEVQKIPSTILSRCQRFDFKRVPQPIIERHLSNLCEKEKIQFTNAAIRLIAKKADGSVRDSLSALDQCIALAGTNLTEDSVSSSLGIMGDSFFLKTLASLTENNLSNAIELLDNAFLSGVEMKFFTTGLADAIKNLILAKLKIKNDLTNLDEQDQALLDKILSHFSVDALQASFKICLQTIDELNRSPLPKACAEIMLVKISNTNELISLSTLLKGGANLATKPALAPSRLVSSIEKKNTIASPNIAIKSTANKSLSFKHFIDFSLDKSPVLGSLLEHTISLTEDIEWPTAQEFRFAFQKTQNFFLQQAQHQKKKIEDILEQFLERKVEVEFILSDKEITQGKVSRVEKKVRSFEEQKSEAKNTFLASEIVKNTKEIFGAELSSFDIDKRNQ